MVDKSRSTENKPYEEKSRQLLESGDNAFKNGRYDVAERAFVSAATLAKQNGDKDLMQEAGIRAYNTFIQLGFQSRAKAEYHQEASWYETADNRGREFEIGQDLVNQAQQFKAEAEKRSKSKLDDLHKKERSVEGAVALQIKTEAKAYLNKLFADPAYRDDPAKQYLQSPTTQLFIDGIIANNSAFFEGHHNVRATAERIVNAIDKTYDEKIESAKGSIFELEQIVLFEHTQPRQIASAIRINLAQNAGISSRVARRMIESPLASKEDQATVLQALVNNQTHNLTREIKSHAQSALEEPAKARIDQKANFKRYMELAEAEISSNRIEAAEAHFLFAAIEAKKQKWNDEMQEAGTKLVETIEKMAEQQYLDDHLERACVLYGLAVKRGIEFELAKPLIDKMQKEYDELSKKHAKRFAQEAMNPLDKGFEKAREPIVLESEDDLAKEEKAGLFKRFRERRRAKKEAKKAKPHQASAQEDSEDLQSQQASHQAANGQQSNTRTQSEHTDTQRREYGTVSSEWLDEIKLHTTLNISINRKIKNMEHGDSAERELHQAYLQQTMSMTQALDLYEHIMIAWREGCGIKEDLLPKPMRIITQEDAKVYHRQHLSAFATYALGEQNLKNIFSRDQDGNQLFNLVYNKIEEPRQYYLVENEEQKWDRIYKRFMQHLYQERQPKDNNPPPPQAPAQATEESAKESAAA